MNLFHVSVPLRQKFNPKMAESMIHDVLIYRVKNSGLEVFMVNHPELDGLQMPKGSVFSEEKELSGCPVLHLEPFEMDGGEMRKAIAVEADWHQIPSLRALIREDFEVAKDKLKSRLFGFLPSMELGGYVAVKEAFKKVAPEQYAFLKELKDIVLEKNSVISI